MVLISKVSNFRPQTILRAVFICSFGLVVTACASSGGYVSHNGKSWGAPNYASNDQQPNQSRQSNRQRASSQRVTGSPHQKIGRPYTISGKTYIPARDDTYNRVGVASWYGPKFHGKKTANGEIFDQYAMTAAHPTLPLPSVARVTHLGTGHQILVRINDRGPFIGNRIIDLSKHAADELGYKSSGVTKVRVEYIGPAPLTGPLLPIAQASVKTNKSSRVNTWPQNPKQKYRVALSKPKTSASGWFVQAGAFTKKTKAKQIARNMQISGQPLVQTAWVGNRYIYRVLVGPYASKSEANAQQREVVQAGFTKARVTEQN